MHVTAEVTQVGSMHESSMQDRNVYQAAVMMKAELFVDKLSAGRQQFANLSPAGTPAAPSGAGCG